RSALVGAAVPTAHRRRLDERRRSGAGRSTRTHRRARRSGSAMTEQNLESHVRAIRELVASGRLQEAARYYVAVGANAVGGVPAFLANAFSPAARAALQTIANTSAPPHQVRLASAVLFLEGGNAPEAERAL